ncbi:MAG: hypothetical protein KF898_08085 [Parachlamydiales bacterium]|nr:hypothetical protein [Verrucomicrobiota bacterium]MBX3719591.1 hypothetical protein [Candidatus Acheromyda pituitae]
MKTKRRKRFVSKSLKKTTRVTVDFSIAQHRKLKAVAALQGVTLQDYIRSKVVPEFQDEDISDEELESIAEKIISENRNALKRLATK